ncbi:MAG: hypothetical protein H7Y36_01720 [Armatimonadetes bacterium]|nr:hypothetical protein [Akkermansiaceae bacterium]
MKFTLAIIPVASLLLSNCATIMSSQAVPTTIDSTPSKMAYKVIDETGAVVSQGYTPSTVTLSRSAGYFKPGKYTIEISKKGRVVGKESVSATVSGWYFGNILIGGLIGMVIVDPMSGAMYRMPENVTVSTTSMASASEPPQALQIVDISTLTSQQRGKLVRI